MATRTATSIVTEALKRAGDGNLSTQGLAWLNDWLKNQYEAWDWPFLYTSGVVPYASGVYAANAGYGAQDFKRVRRILEPLTLYTDDGSVRQSLYLEHPWNIPPDENADILPVGQFTGIPRWVRASPSVEEGNEGVWVLRLGPTPDRAVNLLVPYIYTPYDVTGDLIPRYPNDETMICAVHAIALRYMKLTQEADALLGEVSQRVVNDRSKYATERKINDEMGFDPAVFRPGKTGQGGSNGGWGYFEP